MCINMCIYICVYIYIIHFRHSFYHHSGFVATHALGHMIYKLYTMCPSAWVVRKPLWWKPGGHMFSWLHIYYAHLASVRFEQSVCRGSLMTTCRLYIILYMYIIYIMCIYIFIYVCIYIYIYITNKDKQPISNKMIHNGCK